MWWVTTLCCLGCKSSKLRLCSLPSHGGFRRRGAHSAFSAFYKSWHHIKKHNEKSQPGGVKNTVQRFYGFPFLWLIGKSLLIYWREILGLCHRIGAIPEPLLLRDSVRPKLNALNVRKYVCVVTYCSHPGGEGARYGWFKETQDPFSLSPDVILSRLPMCQPVHASLVSFVQLCYSNSCCSGTFTL